MKEENQKNIIKTKYFRIFEEDGWVYYGIPYEKGERTSGIPDINERINIEILLTLKKILKVID